MVYGQVSIRGVRMVYGHNIGVGGSREEGSGTPHEHPFRTGPTHKGGLSVHTAATTVTSKALNPGWHCV